MSGSRTTEAQDGRLTSALWGLIGTVVTSFLPGLVYALITVYVFNQYTEKFGPEGTVMLMGLASALFTIATTAAYFVGLLPLWLLAQVRRPKHAFSLAVLGSGLSLLSLVTGLSAWLAGLLDFGTEGVVELMAATAALHLVFFSVLCVLYAVVVQRRRGEGQPI